MKEHNPNVTTVQLVTLSPTAINRRIKKRDPIFPDRRLVDSICKKSQPSPPVLESIKEDLTVPHVTADRLLDAQARAKEQRLRVSARTMVGFVMGWYHKPYKPRALPELQRISNIEPVQVEQLAPARPYVLASDRNPDDNVMALDAIVTLDDPNRSLGFAASLGLYTVSVAALLEKYDGAKIYPAADPRLVAAVDRLILRVSSSTDE